MKLTKCFLAILVILFLGNNRKAPPSYNPFDTLFDISRDKLEEDSCKMIGGMGGWFNLTKRIDNVDVYYQFFALEEKVVAKGFFLALDTIPIKELHFLEENQLEDLLFTIPINTQLIQNKIRKYNAVLEKVTKQINEYGTPEVIVEFRTSNKQLIFGEIIIKTEYLDKGFIIRSLGVYRSRKLYKKLPNENEFTDEVELI